MPSVPPERRGAAEYRRSSHRASAPRAIRAASRPARAAVASTACRPRRSRAAPGVTGRSAGHMTMMITPATMTAAGHQAPAAALLRTMPGRPPAARAPGSPLAARSRLAR